MRKRVFGSIFLTSLVTLMLTAGLFLLAVHAGLTRDLRSRLAKEAGYLASTVSADSDLSDISSLGLLCADRLTLISRDGTVLYDNQNSASGMENHLSRPEIQHAAETGVGEDSRLSETLEQQTYYYALRLENGDFLRVSATADSAFGALSSASPWIVLVVLLALVLGLLELQQLPQQLELEFLLVEQELRVLLAQYQKSRQLYNFLLHILRYFLLGSFGFLQRQFHFVHLL